MFRSVNLALAIMLLPLGVFMAYMGLAVLAAGPDNATEWSIGLLAMAAAILLFYGAYKIFIKEKKQEAFESAASLDLQHSLFENTPPPGKSEASNHSVKAPGTPIITEAQQAVYARWLYSSGEWEQLLQRIIRKTRKEELYTAVWFPILFAVVFFRFWYIGLAAGLLTGALYIWVKTLFVAQKFQLTRGRKQAEVIITDAYLRINGHFIHYADGYYYVKDMGIENDNTMGALLHIVIGWTTAKGYAASMDLYLPIPPNGMQDALNTVTAYKKETKAIE